MKAQATMPSNIQMGMNVWGVTITTWRISAPDVCHAQWYASMGRTYLPIRRTAAIQLDAEQHQEHYNKRHWKADQARDLRHGAQHETQWNPRMQQGMRPRDERTCRHSKQ